jgi:hypothetical protein
MHKTEGTPTKSGKKPADLASEIEAYEIKLERIPVENLAQVTETLDRARITAQKLVSKLAEETDKYTSGVLNNVQFGYVSAHIGKGLTTLNQGMKIVLGAAAAKQKLNSGK